MPVSPGIYVNEFDFSEYGSSLGLARPCFVGGATKGPLDKPTLSTNSAELVEQYGPALTTDFGIVAGIKYFEKGDQLLYMRVAASSVAYADRTVPGLSGGTAAIAATGTVGFTASTNPTDAETVTVNDGAAAVAALATCTFTTSIQPTAADTLLIDDGSGVAATANAIFSAQPTTGDLLTVTDGEGNTEIYEYLTAGPLVSGTILVVLGGTATLTRDAMVSAGVGSLNMTIGPATVGVDPAALLTHTTVGLTGNAATLVNTAGTYPVVPATMTGGDGAAMFEFGGSPPAGHILVAIGATIAITLANLITAIGTVPLANMNILPTDTTGSGDPQTTMTHGQPGTGGNSATMVSAGSGTTPTVTSPFAGGSNGTATTFEFDNNAVYAPGNIPVLIGIDADATMANFITTINLQSFGITAVDGTVTIPVVNLTNDVAGDAGNQTITETGAQIGVTGMSGGADVIIGTATNLATFVAKTAGTWANGMRLIIRDTTVVGSIGSGRSDISIYTATGINNTYVLEEFFSDVSLDSTHARYIENVMETGIRGQVPPSILVTVDVIANGTFTANTYDLGTGGGTVGADGLAYTSADVIGVLTPTPSGMQALRNPEAVEYNLLAVPNNSHADVIAEMFAICEERGDAMALTDGPLGTTPAEIVDWHNGLGAGHSIPNSPTGPLDSSYAALYAFWQRLYDATNDRNVWMAPSCFVAANMSEYDKSAGPWFATAGHNRGVIASDEAEYAPTLADRDLMIGTGSGNRVNPIADFATIGDGPTIYGNRTLQRVDSALANIHVRRLLLHAKKLCATAVRVLVFEPHDPVTWKRFEQLCNPILQGIAAQRGLEEFRVVCNATTNPLTQRQKKIMRGILRIKPYEAAEAIVLDFTIEAAGADFSENV